VSVQHELLLLAWGTLVGLDLASVPQVMIARPLVAGVVAGALLGDLPTGLQLGVLFELLQQDVLHLGAARYPEYGPATVASVAAAHATAGAFGVGFGVVVGLFTGLVGGLSVHSVLRPWNTRTVHRAAARLDRGDASALARVHATCLLRDALRGALVTAFGLVLAAGVRPYLVGTLSVRGAIVLAAVAMGTAAAGGVGGMLRLLGQRRNLGWFAAGLLGGAAGVWWR